MFDPNLSIYTVMVLSNLTNGINDDVYNCGPLYITVDSRRSLVLNWDFTICLRRNHPDMVTLHSIDDMGNLNSETTKTNGVVRGSYTTGTSFPKIMQRFPAGWNKNEAFGVVGSHCLPFVIESSKKGRVIDRICMRINPTWMHNYGNLRLDELMIPGTHNSGAYTGVAPLLSNYVYNQDRDLYEQLVFGQRYFDLRVGISEEDKDIFITHNVAQTSKLENELDNILKFTKKSPFEIIIIDIHDFNIPVFWTDAEHKVIINLIQKKLGKYLLRRYDSGKSSSGPTLMDIWKTKKSIIVAYKAPQMVKKHSFLWPPINRDWGDKVVKEDLLKYILEVTKTKPKGNPMRVLMAELTPNVNYVLLNPLGTTAELADIINEDLYYWLSDFDNVTENINIIATDFFLGNQVTEYAIEVNDFRQTRKCKQAKCKKYDIKH